MAVRDPHRFSHELDHDASQRIIARLESRAKDTVFARLFEQYVTQLALPPSAQVLEIGCGTGAMSRSLARRDDFSGKIFGIDQSLSFIEAARQFALDEGVSERIDFQVGDAHSLDFPSETFDAVIAHTLISHVSDPVTVIREMTRVVRSGGVVVIFDGDYASLTFAFPDYEFGHQMDVALANATFNNPLVMRELPRMLPDLGLNIISAWGEAVIEIGKGSYFRSFAETYAPAVIRAGLISAEKVNTWLAAQLESIEEGTFFASCNYYTYLARRK